MSVEPFLDRFETVRSMPLFWFSILNAPSGAVTSRHFWLDWPFQAVACTSALACFDAPTTSNTIPPIIELIR